MVCVLLCPDFWPLSYDLGHLLILVPALLPMSKEVPPPKHQVASEAKSNINPTSVAGAIWNLCPQICEPVSRNPKPTMYISEHEPRKLASFNPKLRHPIPSPKKEILKARRIMYKKITVQSDDRGG